MLTTLTFPVRELRTFINWLYFFHAWQIPASISSNILSNKPQADWDEKTKALFREGRKLYNDASRLLEEFNSKYEVSCRIGIFKANSQGDDILISTGDEVVTLPCLRQQHNTSDKQPNLCLSDFIAPAESGMEDTIGAFATTIPPAMEESYADDAYMHLLSQTLSDRLAEAATEKAHLQVRRSLWGYAPSEDLCMDDLLAEKFQGIRPAVGYPSLPDQSINFLLDSIIDMKSIGIMLTENGAMKPHASVSGFMFAHPKALYFSVGKIGNDQLEDYAKRRKLPIERLQQFLSANLS